MYYHKVNNEWVKTKHSHFSYERERCLTDTPELLCTQVSKTSSGWTVGGIGGVYIWKTYEGDYIVDWTRKIRHVHLEGRQVSDDGKVFYTLPGFQRQMVVMKTESKFAKVVQEALDIYDWLKNQLKVYDEVFYCVSEKDWCKDISLNSIQLGDIDLSFHEVQFNDGFKSILMV